MVEETGWLAASTLQPGERRRPCCLRDLSLATWRTTYLRRRTFQLRSNNTNHPGNLPSDLYTPIIKPPSLLAAPCLQIIKEPIDKYHSPLPPPKKKRKTQHHQARKGGSRVLNYMPCLQLAKWKVYMKKGEEFCPLL